MNIVDVVNRLQEVKKNGGTMDDLVRALWPDISEESLKSKKAQLSTRLSQERQIIRKQAESDGLAETVVETRLEKLIPTLRTRQKTSVTNPLYDLFKRVDDQ